MTSTCNQLAYIRSSINTILILSIKVFFLEQQYIRIDRLSQTQTGSLRKRNKLKAISTRHHNPTFNYTFFSTVCVGLRSSVVRWITLLFGLSSADVVTADNTSLSITLYPNIYSFIDNKFRVSLSRAPSTLTVRCFLLRRFVLSVIPFK